MSYVRQVSNYDDLSDAIFRGEGAAVVPQVIGPKVVEELREWTDSQLSYPDINRRHPKHAQKLLVNNVAERLGQTAPALLLDLLRGLAAVGDPLLGLARVGSLTMHVTEPGGGDPQVAHVDYPLHAKSGQLWDDTQLADITTAYQRNHIYPYLTVQVLIALQDIDECNGCTQVVAGSHLWDDVDVKILDSETRDKLDGSWTNSRLCAGDALIFNRRIIHRASANDSDAPRRACIAQLAMPFVVPQQTPPTPEVVEAVLQEARQREDLTEDDCRRINLCMRFPYPCETEKKN